MRIISTVSCFLVVLIAIPLTAANIFVDLSGTDTGTGSSIDPFKTIQVALDAAADGDSVVVRDGTYSGPGNVDLDFSGSEIVLQAQNALGDVIIDCQGASRAFIFDDAESDKSEVDKIVIRNGIALLAFPDPGNGGGIWITGTAEPTISNCIIENCHADRDGGGIYSESGGDFDTVTIQNNTCTGDGAGAYIMYGRIKDSIITGNQALDTSSNGGGLYLFNSILKDSTIQDNSALQSGGGLALEASQVSGCFIYSNSTTFEDGGGIWGGDGASANHHGASEIVNCVIAGNTAAGSGGGIFAKNMALTQSTIADNTATAGSGGGIYIEDSQVANSIIYSNSASTDADVHDENSNSSIGYSCFSGGTGSNISSDPQFVNLSTSDFRIPAASPCVDNASFDFSNAQDIAGYPRYLSPDRGAYEAAPASVFSVTGTIQDGSSTLMQDVQVWIGHNSEMTNSLGVFTFDDVPAGDYNMIAALEGYSANPNGFTNPVAVASNVAFRDFVVTLLSSSTVYVSDPASAVPGSDITGDGSIANPFATIQMGLHAAPIGGAVMVMDGTYDDAWDRDLDFMDKDINVQSVNGSGSTTIDCMNMGRAVTFNGGESNLSILDGFTITNGSVSGLGGGIWIWGDSKPTVRNCIISNCQAGVGGGIAAVVLGGGPDLYNLVIHSCNSNGEGGGAYLSGATLYNSTVFGNNAAVVGGGVSAKNSATVKNCILWNNTATSFSQVIAPGSTVIDCCVEGGATGTRILTGDPLFVDTVTFDLHLTASSSSADPAGPTGSPANDHDGNPRDGSPDLGAYEYQEFVISGGVTGPGISGAFISMTGDSIGSVTTTGTGLFSFTVSALTNNTLTTTQTGFIYSPSTTDVAIVYGDKTGMNFSSTPAYQLTVSVSDNWENVDVVVTGTNSLGDVVTLTGITDLSGSVVFMVADGTYTITPTRLRFVFNPSSKDVTVNGADLAAPQIVATYIPPKKGGDSGGCVLDDRASRSLTWGGLLAIAALAGAVSTRRREELES